MTTTPGSSRHPRSVEMVVPSLEVGGMERMVCRLAVGLQQRDWRVGVTCTERIGPLGERLVEDGVPVQWAPAPGVRSWFSAPRLAEGLRSRAPAIVHSHSGVWLRAVRAVHQARVRCAVHTVHGLLAHEPWYGPWEKRLAACFTARVVGVSQDLVEYLGEKARLSRGQLRFIPNGVPTDEFRPGQRSGRFRRLAQLPPGGLLIGTVARLDPIKNLGLLVRAFARLYQADDRHRLIIAGDGPEAGMLASLIGELGVNNAVLLLGLVDDAAEVYADLDAFVLPSRSEGMSLSLQEAMSTGIACLATDVGGNREVLDDGKAGLLVPSEDVDRMHAALRELERDPSLRNRLGQAGRARVETHFSVEGMVEAYAKLYRELTTDEAGYRHGGRG